MSQRSISSSDPVELTSPVGPEGFKCEAFVYAFVLNAGQVVYVSHNREELLPANNANGVPQGLPLTKANTTDILQPLRWKGRLFAIASVNNTPIEFQWNVL